MEAKVDIEFGAMAKFTTPATKPSAGRPRDPAVDSLILTAARDVVADAGYEKTTVVAIAARAGVSVPTVYRRWGSKSELVEDAILDLDGFDPPTPSGSLYLDIRQWVEWFFDISVDPLVRAASPGLLAGYSHDPTSEARVVRQGERVVHAALERAIADAVGRGETVSDRDLSDTLSGMIRGATFLQTLTCGDQGRDEFCDRVASAAVLMVTSVGG